MIAQGVKYALALGVSFTLAVTRHHAIRFESIQSLVGRWQNRPFFRYTEEESSTILEHFSELNHNSISEVSLDEARQDIQDHLTDGIGSRPTRLEHKYIVRHLFQNKPSGHCCICLNEYPRHLLVAAHIKKRSACSTKEKLDIENIAAPMCRLGCDPLFEHGYLAVREGKVVKHPSREMTKATENYVEQLIGKQVLGWSTKNRKYYDWHLTAHGFEPGELADLS